MYKQSFTPDQALPKAKHYCAYQERCHSEVEEKLNNYGLNKKEVNEIIAQLIEENYLNEERFAIHFAGGKFRTKQWGRVKIKYELRKKQLSDYCIKKALASIDENEYFKIIQKTADGKLKNLKNEKNILIKKRKLQNYLMQKGFETNLVREIIIKL